MKEDQGRPSQLQKSELENYFTMLEEESFTQFIISLSPAK